MFYMLFILITPNELDHMNCRCAHGIGSFPHFPSPSSSLWLPNSDIVGRDAADFIVKCLVDDLTMFQGFDQMWAIQLVYFVHDKQLRPPFEQVSIYDLVFAKFCMLKDAASSNQSAAISITRRLLGQTLKGRILLNHSIYLWLMYTNCDWFNCLFQHLPAEQSSHAARMKVNWSQSGFVRTCKCKKLIAS